MFILNVKNFGINKTYAFSSIENCIDFINFSKDKAIEDNSDIYFEFTTISIDNTYIPNTIILFYNVYDKKIFVCKKCDKIFDNNYEDFNTLLNIKDELTSEILYDIFKEKKFNICGNNMLW